jgi:4-amino-4-deoxy-L-arabinose transferase-like glycosyltransferase
MDQKKKRVLFLLIVVVCSYVFFFLNLGAYSLKDPDEGRYAEIPREMVESGNYLVPHFNYVRYFEKPPLLYWATAASYKLFGINEWSARFPNAVAAILCVLATYMFTSRAFGADTALIASVMLTTSFGFFAMARTLTTDMLFASMLSISLFSFGEYYREKRVIFLHLFFVTLALAVLTKGPVAVVLMAVTVFIFLLLENDLSFSKKLISPTGWLLFAVIAAPWFVIMCIREKQFFQFFFIDQHILRFLTTKHNRSGPLYYFIPVLFAGLFPWSIFLPRAILEVRKVREVRLFLIWSLVVFLFFSLSGSKLPTYILPVFPALVIVLGNLFARHWQRPMNCGGELITYLVVFTCIALSGFALCTGRWMTVPGSDFVSTSDIHFFAIGLAVASMAILALLLIRTMRTFATFFFMLGAFSLVVVIGLLLHVHIIDGIKTSKAVAREIRLADKGGSVVVNYGSFLEGLPFYLSRRIHLADFDGELEMGSKFPEAKGYFLKPHGFVSLFKSDRPVLVVLKARRMAVLRNLGINNPDVIKCEQKYCLIANRKAFTGAASESGNTAYRPGLSGQ